jgi:hypothetical protein
MELLPEDSLSFRSSPGEVPAAGSQVADVVAGGRAIASLG